MPFTHDQFLDLFGVYNSQFWLAAIVLWMASAAAVIQHLRGKLARAGATWLLVIHWAWSGIVYHALFFTRINPVAWLFAALFVLQAGLMAWYALGGRRLSLNRFRGSTRSHVADVLLVAALAYPGLVLASGFEVPRAPLFAVPCPTVLLTAGLLLAMAPSAPRTLSIVPVLWALVGGVAAVTFGVVPDYLLFGAALGLVLSALVPDPAHHDMVEARRRAGASTLGPAPRR